MNEYTNYRLFNLHQVRVYHHCDEMMRKQCPGQNESIYASGAVHLVQFIQSVFGRELPKDDLVKIIGSSVETLKSLNLFMTMEDGDLLNICITPQNLYILFLVLFELSGLDLMVWKEEWRNKIYRRASTLKDTLKNTREVVSIEEFSKVLLEIEKAILVSQPYMNTETIYRRYLDENVRLQQIETGEKEKENLDPEPLPKKFSVFLAQSYQELQKAIALNEASKRAILETELLIEEAANQYTLKNPHQITTSKKTRTKTKSKKNVKAVKERTNLTFEKPEEPKTPITHANSNPSLNSNLNLNSYITTTNTDDDTFVKVTK